MRIDIGNRTRLPTKTFQTTCDDAKSLYKDALFSAQTANTVTDDIVDTQNLSFSITTFGKATTHWILIDSNRLSDLSGLFNPLQHI